MNKVIHLFWWNKSPNFGDAISPEIVAFVSGKRVVWASPENCELVAVGSIMGMVAKAINQCQGPLKVIWGSGCFGPNPLVSLFSQSEHVDVSLVRGPLSGMICGVRDRPVGDPALLADRIYGSVEQSQKTGVVLHHSQWNNKSLVEKIASDPNLLLIDVRSCTPGKVVRAIASCQYIVSSSLHGLIIADSYGIPNAWLAGAPSAQSDLKFYDYALSVGRKLLKPCPLRECLSSLHSIDDYQISYLCGIEKIKNDIHNSFPASKRECILVGN